MKNIITGPWTPASREQALGRGVRHPAKPMTRLRAWLFDCAPDLILLAALTTLVGVFLYNYLKHHDVERVERRLGEMERACRRDHDRCGEYVNALQRACTMGVQGACKAWKPTESAR